MSSRPRTKSRRAVWWIKSVRAIIDKGKIKIFIWQAGRELHGLCQVEHGEKISLPIPIFA